MNKIPKGWEVKKLGEIFNIVTGKTPSKKIREYFNGNIPFVKPSDLDLSDYIENSEDTLTQDGFKKAPFIPKNSVLVSCIGNLGKKAILKQNGSCNQQINAILPNSNFDMKFVFYYIDIIKPWMEQNASATTISILNKSRFEQMPFIYPNLVEQKAIADKLDDSFAKIENAITNLINAKENLKLYKQSVLKSAFNGDLLPNTSPTHWEVKKLGEICEINPKTEILLLNESDEVSFIPMASVEAETNIFTESKSKFSKVKKGYTKFKDNDILFAKITPCMENGKICIVNNLKFGIGFGSTEFHVIRPNKNTLSKYIYYFVSQISFRQMAQIYMTGAVGQRRVPSKILENFEIPLPPLSEQNLIVAEIDRRFAIVDKTLNLIDKSIQNAKNLKQSILKKAFSGELRSEI